MLRDTLRATRRSLLPATQKAHAYAVAHILETQPWFKADIHVACYLPIDGELDLTPYITSAWAQGLHCYLPRLEGNTLHFFAYTQKTLLIPNKWGILEPLSNNQPMPIANLDVILLPLVGFTAEGFRLGMGGGYYDRTLAPYSDHPYRIGVAHDCQRLPAWQPAPWDIHCHAIATESTFMVLKSR